MVANNIQKYENFRNDYPVFVYNGITSSENEKEIHIVFDFEIMGLAKFLPTLSVLKKNVIKRDLGTDLDEIIYYIGLVEAISYWKLTCSPIFRIKNFSLTESQQIFWKKLFFNGLGEFFYLNGLNPDEDSLVKFEFENTAHLLKRDFDVENSLVIPIGGGKDSAVTLQILLDGGFNVAPFIMNSRLATEQTVQTAGISMGNVLEVKRVLDPELIQLNKKGFFNGHTPFSALLAFVTVFVAVLSRKKHIALSNESSANEPTIPGTKINHQYSKSLEFENDFRNYLNSNVTSSVNYFSFLRPLTELQIASLLAKNKKYLPVFKSCNVGSKTDIWCGVCPKCLFTFIMLLPFLEYNDIVEIFGKDLLGDENLKSYFEELTGIATVKPFECVGTIEEVNIALFHFVKNKDYSDLPVLAKYFVDIAKSYIEFDFAVEMHRFEYENNLPIELESLLKKKINEL